MAHGITNTDNMIFNTQNGLPWHRLGIGLPGLSTMESVLEAVPSLAASVRKEQIYHPRTGEEVEGKFFTVREDIDEILGVVGSKYRVLQNADAFKFFDAFTADPHGPKYETAGTLWGGRKVFILAKLPDFIEVLPGDIVNPYILLSNSHDGSSAVVIKETPIRVVCQNTLSMAMNSEGRRKNIRHSGDIFKKVEDVQEALGIVRENFLATAEVYKHLTQVTPTDAQVEAVLSQLFDPKDGEETGRSKKQKERVMMLYSDGLGSNIKGVKNTAWGFYNAVTELVDHHNNAGAKGEDVDSMRTENIWFGGGAKTKEEAFNLMVGTFLS